MCTRVQRVLDAAAQGREDPCPLCFNAPTQQQCRSAPKSPGRTNTMFKNVWEVKNTKMRQHLLKPTHVSEWVIVSEIAIASTDLASLFHMKGPQRVYSSPFAGQLAAVRICFHRPLIHHLPIFSTLSSNSEPLTQLSCLPTLNTLKYLFLNLNLHLCLLSPFRYLYLQIRDVQAEYCPASSLSSSLSCFLVSFPYLYHVLLHCL